MSRKNISPNQDPEDLSDADLEDVAGGSDLLGSPVTVLSEDERNANFRPFGRIGGVGQS